MRRAHRIARVEAEAAAAVQTRRLRHFTWIALTALLGVISAVVLAALA